MLFRPLRLQKVIGHGIFTPYFSGSENPQLFGNSDKFESWRSMKIASIFLFVLLIASIVSLVLTTNALKSTKAQLARVQAQLADEVAHASALQHALQAERVANNEYLEKTKKADETRDAFMRVARDLDVVPIDDGVRKSAIDAYKSLICADSVPSSR